MIFPNKPDEDWYWRVKILYTLGLKSHFLISLCSSSLFDFKFYFYLFRLITILFDPTLSNIDCSRFLHWFFKPLFTVPLRCSCIQHKSVCITQY